MSIATPANPKDTVRLVSEEDAPWADTGIGVLLKVSVSTSNTGPGSSSTASSQGCSCRPIATPGPSTCSPRPVGGTTSSTTST